MQNRRSSQRAYDSHHGMTLIEVVVVMAIISVLLSLLLPAVLQSRESARATQCRSRLRQIGVALQSYEATNLVLPPALAGITLPSNRIDYFSPYSKILSYLDQTSVAQRINWNGTAAQPASLIQGEAPGLAELKCPTDPGVPLLGASFAFSTGALPGPYPPIDLLPAPHRRLVGCFTMYSLRLNEIRDGLSNTIGMAEMRSGSGNGFDVGRDVVMLSEAAAPAGDAFSPSYWITLCRGVSNTITMWEGGRGHFWITAEWLLYSHALPPNARIVDCVFYGFQGLLTARSYHPGQCHVLVMDGSVRGIANSVDASIWWAWGTRQGQEAVTF